LRDLVFIKAPSFIAAVLLAFVAIMGSWILGLSILSFALTSIIFLVTLILLLRIVFKNGRNLVSWFTYARSDDRSGNELIAKAGVTVKGAAKGYYYDRTKIADILRTALAPRFGGQSDGAHWRFASRENAREELNLLVGKNPRVLEIFAPTEEDEGQRRRFGTRSSREQEEYLSSLEEAIRVISESGT
jgi:hypothetical protein